MYAIRSYYAASAADCNRSGLWIGTDEIPHEKIALLESVAMLVDGDADVQGAMSIS